MNTFDMERKQKIMRVLHRLKVISEQPGLVRNGLFSLIESLVKLVCVFLAYRIFVQEEGLRGLGLWALLMVFSNFAGPVDISGASALARTVARRNQDHSYTDIATVIHSVLLTSIGINFVLGALVMLALPPLLPWLVAADQLVQAKALVPWLVAVMMFTGLSVGVGASLDGLGRADIRARIVASMAALQLCLVWLLIEENGVEGFAAATLAQLMVCTVVGWICLARLVPDMGWAPYRWSSRVVRSSAAYAVKLNAVGLFTMALEPVVRFFLNLSGGTAAVGAYELASKLVVQLRGLVLAGLTPMIPAVAGVDDDQLDKLHKILRNTQLFVSISALFLFIVCIAAAPLLCLVVLGYIDIDIIYFSIILGFSAAVNIFALPLFLSGQGRGILIWNFISTLFPVFGAIVGYSVDLQISEGLTVVIGTSIGTIIGSVISIIGNGNTMMHADSLKNLYIRLIIFIGAISFIALSFYAFSSRWIA